MIYLISNVASSMDYVTICKGNDVDAWQNGAWVLLSATNKITRSKEFKLIYFRGPEALKL